MLLQLLAVLTTPQSLHTLVGNIGGLGKLFKKQVFYINFKLAFRYSDAYMKIPSTTETSLLLEILLAHDNYENKITQHSWCLCYKQFRATYPAEETTRATLNGEPSHTSMYLFQYVNLQKLVNLIKAIWGNVKLFQWAKSIEKILRKDKY